MKRILLNIIFLTLIIAPETIYAQNFTISSYNVRQKNSGDAKQGDGWDIRHEHMCDFIQFENIDILGTQEAFKTQIDDMLEDMPEYSYIGAGRDDGKEEGEHCAIFYKTDRFKVLKSGNFWLSQTPEKPSKGWDAALPRICSWGYFKDKVSKKKIYVFNLHMDHIGVNARVQGGKQVLKYIQENCKKTDKVFLMGDFNVDQNTDTYTTIANSGVLLDSYHTAEKKYASIGTANNFSSEKYTISRIDHIFTSPNLVIKNYGVLTETYRSGEDGEIISSGNFPVGVKFIPAQSRQLSDHFPVIIKVEL